jgi:hypothetical protein
MIWQLFELNRVLGSHRDFKYYADRYVQGLCKTKEHENNFLRKFVIYNTKSEYEPRKMLEMTGETRLILFYKS